MLIEARCDGSVVLNLVEEALDEVAAFIETWAESRWIDTMVEWSDVGGCALVGDHGAQRIAIVAAIGQQDALARQRAEHVLGTFAIMGLALGQLERDGEAACIDERVDLGRKPAAGAAHATTSTAFFSLLAAC